MLLKIAVLTLAGSALLLASPLSIDNSGFETPDITVGFGGCAGTITGGTYIYNPTGCGAGWTFEGGSGLTRTPSAFNNPAGADGSAQAGFLQGPADFYQSITGVEVGGLYTISFYAIQRTCCDSSFAQTISVQFGNQTLTFNGGADTSVHPVTAGWTQYTTDAFIAQAGTQILKFSGNYTGGDATAFIDQVSSTENGVVPEPGTWTLLATGLAGLVISRYKR